MTTTKQTDIDARLEILLSNMATYKTQIGKLENLTLDKFVETNEQRIMLAPASTRLEYTCAYTGGLVEHSLRVLQNLAKLRKTFAFEENIPVKSVILTSLLHDIGKIGTATKDYYIECDSQWHKEKLGQMFNIVEKFNGIQVSHLSLFHLNQNSIPLDLEEISAILSIRDHSHTTSDPSTPQHGENLLAVLLQQSVKLACLTGKNKKEVSVVK